MTPKILAKSLAVADVTECTTVVGNTAVLDEVAADLRTVHARAALELSVAVAQILVNRLFEGDISAWRQRKSDCPSLRELAARPDVPFATSSLFRALAVNELVERMGGLRACYGLCAAHFQEVISVSDDLQIGLLQQARIAAWSARDLAKHVRAINSGGTPRLRRGRKRVPPMLRELRRLGRLCSDSDSPLAVKFFGELSPRDAGEATELVQLVRARLDLLSELFRADS